MFAIVKTRCNGACVAVSVLSVVEENGPLGISDSRRRDHFARKLHTERLRERAPTRVQHSAQTLFQLRNRGRVYGRACARFLDLSPAQSMQRAVGVSRILDDGERSRAVFDLAERRRWPRSGRSPD